MTTAFLTQHLLNVKNSCKYYNCLQQTEFSSHKNNSYEYFSTFVFIYEEMKLWDMY